MFQKSSTKDRARREGIDGRHLRAAALGGLADVVVDALADGAGFSMHGIVSASRLFTSRRWRLKHVAQARSIVF